jgi:hypothetical protein
MACAPVHDGAPIFTLSELIAGAETKLIAVAHAKPKIVFFITNLLVSKNVFEV